MFLFIGINMKKYKWMKNVDLKILKITNVASTN